MPAVSRLVAQSAVTKSAVTKSIAISAAANAGSLAIAAWVFGHFTVSFGWYVVAVIVFTALTVLLRGIVLRTVDRFARGYAILGGLVLTLLGLALTELAVPENGFHIHGWGTWIGVTLIVWAAGVAYGEVDSAPPVPRSSAGHSTKA